MTKPDLKIEDVLGFKFPTSLLGQSKAFSIIYYVDGLLIDTGHQRKRKSIIKTVANLDVEQLFITHHHEDHSGNIHELQSRFGCEVLGSDLCCELMKNPPALSLAQKLYWGSRPPYHNMIPVSGKLTTNHYEFEIIPITGHAPDMVALYEPNKKWMFSADLFIHHRIGYFITTESMLAQIESMRKVLSYDFEVLFCSHNPQLKNGKQKLQEKVDYFESFYEKVSTLHAKGLSEQEIFNTMKLKELRMIKLLSGGYLSKMNMVRSVIRDVAKK